jgi:hypothetical protein
VYLLTSSWSSLHVSVRSDVHHNPLARNDNLPDLGCCRFADEMGTVSTVDTFAPHDLAYVWFDADFILPLLRQVAGIHGPR